MLILKDMLWYIHNVGMGAFLMKLIRYLFLTIDSIIYGFIASTYEMFTFMSQIRVFENEEMKALTNRVYILVGVVAMFFVAYALICAIINPDNATKGKNNSLTGIVKNIIIAIVGVAIVPTIFNYAYDFQNVILCQNIIEKFFLENNVTGTENEDAKMGNQLELYLFKSFYYINDSVDDTIVDVTEDGTETSNWETRASQITSDEDTGKTLLLAFQNIENGSGTIADELVDFDLAIYNKQVTYLFLLSTIAGLYCAYVLLGFVIDMGVRSVKLAYLQLIAPIPIFSIIVPGQKKVFDNWFKKTKNCFLEVFIRVIGLSFAFYAIKYLRPWIFSGGVEQVVCTGSGIGGVTKLLAQAVYILGVFAFLKQLPKFISDMFGIDSKGFKLGLGNALAETGGLQMLGAAGGMVTAGTRNFAYAGKKNWESASAAWKNGQRGKAIGEAFKGIGNGVKASPSVLAGAASGGARAFIKGKDSKKWSDVAKYAGEGADAAMEAKLKREDYKAEHGGTVLGAAAGHVSDVKDKIFDFPNAHKANYAYESKKHNGISTVANASKAIDDELNSYIEKHESELLFNGETIAKLKKNASSADSLVDGLNNQKAQYLAQGFAEDSDVIKGINDKINKAQMEAISANSLVKAAQKDVRIKMRKNAKIESLDKSGNKVIFSMDKTEVEKVSQLYTDYNTALKEHASDLIDNKKAYDDAMNILASNDFRSAVENTKDFIDNVKIADARVVTKMNQEGEAARKQQEKK